MGQSVGSFVKLGVGESRLSFDQSESQRDGIGDRFKEIRDVKSHCHVLCFLSQHGALLSSPRQRCSIVGPLGSCWVQSFRFTRDPAATTGSIRTYSPASRDCIVHAMSQLRSGHPSIWLGGRRTNFGGSRAHRIIRRLPCFKHVHSLPRCSGREALRNGIRT